MNHSLSNSGSRRSPNEDPTPDANNDHAGHSNSNNSVGSTSSTLRARPHDGAPLFNNDSEQQPQPGAPTDAPTTTTTTTNRSPEDDDADSWKEDERDNLHRPPRTPTTSKEAEDAAKNNSVAADGDGAARVRFRDDDDDDRRTTQNGPRDDDNSDANGLGIPTTGARGKSDASSPANVPTIETGRHDGGDTNDDDGNANSPANVPTIGACSVVHAVMVTEAEEQVGAPAPKDPSTIIADVLQVLPAASDFDGTTNTTSLDRGNSSSSSSSSNGPTQNGTGPAPPPVNSSNDNADSPAIQSQTPLPTMTSGEEEEPNNNNNRQPPMALSRRKKWLIWAVALAVIAVVVAATVIAVVVTASSSEGGDNDPLQTKLTASDGAADDRFGTSVAINGDTIVIGAEKDDDNGTNSGSAYVYTRSGSDWTEQAKLTASDGAADDEFGTSVAMDGDTIVIGAEKDDDNGTNSGSAYVYTLSGSVWTEQAKLLASDGAADDWFGNSVAVEGNTIVIGAFYSTTENGSGSVSAHVYTRSGTVWTEQVKLTASDGAENGWFGLSVAVDGNTIVIGAYDSIAENNSGSDSGWDSAYVYTLSGTVWTEQAKLTASDGAEENWFGHSVATDGNTIVVGAQLGAKETGLQSGSVFVYTRSGTVWTEQAILTASDGARYNQFGFSVAIDGDAIIIGANRGSTEYAKLSGSAYVYTLSGTVWTEQAKLLTGDGLAGDRFGSSVAIDGDTIVIGADPFNREDGGNGSAYVFALSGIISIRLEACMYLIYTAAYVVLF